MYYVVLGFTAFLIGALSAGFIFLPLCHKYKIPNFIGIMATSLMGLFAEPLVKLMNLF
jgi:hypothetical protein